MYLEHMQVNNSPPSVDVLDVAAGFGNERFNHVPLAHNTLFKHASDSEEANATSHDGYTNVDAPFAARRLFYSALLFMEDNKILDLELFDGVLSHLGVASFSEYWALLLCGCPAGGPRYVSVAAQSNKLSGATVDQHDIAPLMLPQSMFSMALCPAPEVSEFLFEMLLNACLRPFMNSLWKENAQTAALNSKEQRALDLISKHQPRERKGLHRVYWYPQMEMGLERRHLFSWVTEALFLNMDQQLANGADPSAVNLFDMARESPAAASTESALITAGMCFHGSVLKSAKARNVFWEVGRKQIEEEQLMQARLEAWRLKKEQDSSPVKVAMWQQESAAVSWEAEPAEEDESFEGNDIADGVLGFATYCNSRVFKQDQSCFETAAWGFNKWPSVGKLCCCPLQCKP